jgi:hypothetical protein
MCIYSLTGLWRILDALGDIQENRRPTTTHKKNRVQQMIEEHISSSW